MFKIFVGSQFDLNKQYGFNFDTCNIYEGLLTEIMLSKFFKSPKITIESDLN